MSIVERQRLYMKIPDKTSGWVTFEVVVDPKLLAQAIGPRALRSPHRETKLQEGAVIVRVLEMKEEPR